MDGVIITTPGNTKKKKINKKFIILAIVSFITLIGGILAGVFIVKSRQLFNQEASTPGGTVKVSISPENKTINAGDTFTSKIYLDSAGIAISAMTIQLEYPYQGDEPSITATDIQINSALLTDNWDFPIKSINSSNGKVLVRIAGFSNSISGFTTTGNQELATIAFKGNSSGSINLTFNQTDSKVTQKSDGVDILLTPQSTGVYTVSGDSSTTTPTPTATATSDPDATETPTASPASSQDATATPAIVYPAATNDPIPVTGVNDLMHIGIGVGIILIIASILLAI